MSQPIIQVPKEVWQLILDKIEPDLKWISVLSEGCSEIVTVNMKKVTKIHGPYWLQGKEYLQIKLSTMEQCTMTKEKNPKIFDKLIKFTNYYS